MNQNVPIDLNFDSKELLRAVHNEAELQNDRKEQ